MSGLTEFTAAPAALSGESRREILFLFDDGSWRVSWVERFGRPAALGLQCLQRALPANHAWAQGVIGAANLGLRAGVGLEAIAGAVGFRRDARGVRNVVGQALALILAARRGPKAAA